MLSQNSFQKLFTSNYVSFCFSLKFIKNHNIWTLEIPTRKNLEPTKYLPEKI